MKVAIQNILVEFDVFPPLNRIKAETGLEYWLLSLEGATQRRIIRFKNIIEDLLEALEQDLFKGCTDLEIHMHPHSAYEENLEPLICYKRVRIDQCSGTSAWCLYDLTTGNLLEIFPNLNACVQRTGINKFSIRGCDQGDIAVLKGNLIPSRRFLLPEELELRKRVNSNISHANTRVYAYNYNGEYLGMFGTLRDASIYFGINIKSLRSGILNIHKNLHGYYFYIDETMRPPVDPKNLFNYDRD